MLSVRESQEDRDRKRMLQEDIDPDEATLEELARHLIDEHIEDPGLLGAIARRADDLLKEMGE